MIFISINLCIGIYAKESNYSNDNDITKIHIVFMTDVSYSMKSSYDHNDLEGKSGKIYDLFEDITNQLSSKNKNNIQVSGILFGAKRG